MAIRRIWPDTVYRRVRPGSPNPVYAQVVEVTRPAGGTSIHIAGTFPADVNQELIGADDMGAQVAAVLENIRLSLAAVGADFSHLVRIKLYTLDLDRFGREGRPQYQQLFGDHPPASTAVQVSGLAMPGALVEIEAYAELTE